MQETQEIQVRSLGQGEPLEKEMATHSSILAWRIPWTEEPGGLQSMAPLRVGYYNQQESRIWGVCFAFSLCITMSSTLEQLLAPSAQKLFAA